MKDYSVSRLALLAWVASQGVPAFSQQAQEDEQAQEGTSEPGSSDIVVTAQRRSESIMRVPIAVTALGTDTLASRGISNASGLASAEPRRVCRRLIGLSHAATSSWLMAA